LTRGASTHRMSMVRVAGVNRDSRVGCADCPLNHARPTGHARPGPDTDLAVVRVRRVIHNMGMVGILAHQPGVRTEIVRMADRIVSSCSGKSVSVRRNLVIQDRVIRAATDPAGSIRRDNPQPRGLGNSRNTRPPHWWGCHVKGQNRTSRNRPLIDLGLGESYRTCDVGEGLLEDVFGSTEMIISGVWQICTSRPCRIQVRYVLCPN